MNLWHRLVAENGLSEQFFDFYSDLWKKKNSRPLTAHDISSLQFRKTNSKNFFFSPILVDKSTSLTECFVSDRQTTWSERIFTHEGSKAKRKLCWQYLQNSKISSKFFWRKAFFERLCFTAKSLLKSFFTHQINLRQRKKWFEIRKTYKWNQNAVCALRMQILVRPVKWMILWAWRNLFVKVPSTNLV